MPLSGEQQQYVKEALGIEPTALTTGQAEYIEDHWNKAIDSKLDLEEYKALFPPPALTPEQTRQSEEALKALKEVVAFEEKQTQLFQRVTDIPEPEWVVEGFAVKEGITILFGDKGQGKTSLMLQLIGCVQEGKSLVSLRVGEARTLLIEQDENPALLRGHLDRMLPVHPSLENLLVPKEPVRWNNDKMNFDNPAFIDDLMKYSKADLVIIDSLSSVGIEDINHPKGAAIFDQLRILARKWNCAFIVLHHPNKNGEVMGSNLIQAKVDVILRLHDGALSFYKLRGKYPAVVDTTVQPPRIRIAQDKATLVFSPDKATIAKNRADRIRKLVSEKRTRAEIVEITHKEFGGDRTPLPKPSTGKGRRSSWCFCNQLAQKDRRTSRTVSCLSSPRLVRQII